MYAHPIKLSTSKLDLSTNTLTINLFEDDFKAHLLKTYRQQLDFEQADSITKQVVNAYLSKNFKIHYEENLLPLHLQSIQFLNKNVVQVIFSVSRLPTSASLKITNSILTDAFDNQNNILHFISNDGEKSTLQFSKDQPSETLKL